MIYKRTKLLIYRAIEVKNGKNSVQLDHVILIMTIEYIVTTEIPPFPWRLQSA
jgi:hypothetical protein